MDDDEQEDKTVECLLSFCSSSRPLVSTFSSLISIFNSHKQSLAACSLFLLDKKNGSHVNKVNEAFR